MAVFKKIFLISVLLMSACTLVKQEKYISTDKFRSDAYKLCMSSKKFAKESSQYRKLNCQKDAQTFITSAENKFRQYKADEHNYRLCRSRFSDIQASDNCFRQQQEKYYRRELDGYKAKLN